MWFETIYPICRVVLLPVYDFDSGTAVLWIVIMDLLMSPLRMEKSLAPAIIDH